MDELSPDNHYVSTRLTKGTLSLDEMQTLLLAWEPGEDAMAFAGRVRERGLLAKQTAKRNADVVNLLRAWLFVPDETPAHNLRRLIEVGADRQTLAHLLFLYKARAERALHDFTVEAYWPAADEGALYLRTGEIEQFLQRAVDTGRAVQPWTANTQTRMAQGILRALIDADFVGKSARGAHEVESFTPAPFAPAYLAYDLHLAGVTDSALVEDEDWHLWGYDRTATIAALEHLPEQAGILVQHGGGIVTISWRYTSMKEVIDGWFG